MLLNICIFGASSSQLEQVYYSDAISLGKQIAQAGHTLIFGGGIAGLMGACASAVKEAGGRLVGIAPKIFNEPGILISDCQKLIITESMTERKEMMLDMADAFIVLPGGIGTMDEFFEILTLTQLGLRSSPIVLLNTNGFYMTLMHLLSEMAGKHFMSEKCLHLLRFEDSPESALAAAVKPLEVRGNALRLNDYV